MKNHGRPKKCDPRVDNLRADIRQNNLEIAKATLADFGIDAGDGDGRTAIINAVIENKPVFIKWLIDKGADINHLDRKGYTALHFAASMRSVELAAMLLKKGADPNLQDEHGNSPLWTAVFSSMGEDISIVKILLKYNANPDLMNKHDNSPGKLYQERYNEGILSLDLS